MLPVNLVIDYTYHARYENEVDENNDRIPEANHTLSEMHSVGSLCHEALLRFQLLLLNLVEGLPIIEYAYEFLGMQALVFQYANGQGELNWIDLTATAEVNFHVENNEIFYSDSNAILNYLIAVPTYHFEPMLQLESIGEGIPLKIKLLLVGRNFSNVRNHCSLACYEGVKAAVRARPTTLKTFAFFSSTHANPFLPENVVVRRGMNRYELQTVASASIRNKLLLIARVLWFIVTPIEQDESGQNQPKVFCCLFHNGHWVFQCDFKNFEKSINFKRELKILEKAADMDLDERLTAIEANTLHFFKEPK